MWIAGGVNIAFRSIKRRGYFQQLNSLSTRDVPGSPVSQLGVARLVQQRGEPSYLELSAAFDKDVGAIELHNEAGLGIHEMRIFGWFGQDGEIDILTADLLRDGCQVGCSGDHVQFGICGQWEE